MSVEIVREDPAVTWAKRNGLVVLAGAGVSMDRPASLPGWFAFNDLVIDALCGRVTNYLDRDGWLDDVRKGMRIRRDQLHQFPPEYQAQLIEEQCGDEYFRVLQALDSPQRNMCHECIATLAAAGYLRAIVTTNFDRLIERSLAERNVAHRVYFNAEHYRQFAELLSSREPDHAEIPVLKIHGSVEDTASMIDTLKQRLRGREDALIAALDQLLRRHYWCYAGFSGADLNQDPNYLGLCAAADDSPGLSFVLFPKSTLTAGAQILKARYGGKAVFHEATLGEWFGKLLDDLNVDIPAEPPDVETAPFERVKATVEAWANQLNPFAAINVLAGLLESAGEEYAAFRLMHKTWKWRIPADCQGPHYARYQFNYARLCTASGELEYEETLQNFCRSREEIPEADTHFALFSFWCGRLEWFKEYMVSALGRTRDQVESFIDAKLVWTRYCDLYGNWKEGLREALSAAESMRLAGDHPRYARAMAMATLLAGRLGRVEAACGYFDQALAIAHRLGEETILGELYYGRGVAKLFANSAQEAWDDFHKASDYLVQNHRWPLHLGLQIEMGRAAADLNLWENSSEIFNRIDKDIDRFPVWLPLFHIAGSEAYIQMGQLDEARRRLQQGLEYAEKLGNDAAHRKMLKYLKQIKEGRG